jgi:O-antigen/teichoic acid export membrane protein
MLRKNIKELFRHSLVYSLAWVSSSLASILLMPVYTRYLSRADYGILEILEYTNTILRLILVAGFHTSLAKFYSDEREQSRKMAVISTGMIFVFCMGLAGTAIGIVCHTALSQLLFGSGDFSRYIRVNMIVLFADLLVLISTTYFVVSKQSRFFLIYSLSRLFIGICANLYFIVVLQKGAMGMLYGNLTATGLLAVVITSHVLWINKIRIDIGVLKRMLKFSLPIIPAMLAATVMHNADRFLIRYYGTLSDVGLYGLGYKFPFMLNALILQSFNFIWSGVTMYEISKQSDARYQYSKITTYFMTLFVFSQFALGILSSSVVKILAAPKFFPAHHVIPLICLGLCFHAFYTFFTVGAFLKEKTWLLSLSYVPAAAINIAGNILLLPRYGYMAAAWMSVLTYFVFSALAYLSCRNELKVSFEIKRLVVVFSLAILLYLVSSRIVVDNIILDILKGVIFMILFLGLLWSKLWSTKNERFFAREKLAGVFAVLK